MIVMHATVLQKACIRCGMCASICPEVFSLPDDGESARAICDTVPEEYAVSVQEAADSCPTSAIEVR